MKTKRILIIFFLFGLLLSFRAEAQSPLLVKKFAVIDTLRIDNLSLIPGSVTVFSEEKPMDTSFYKIDYFKSLVVFTSEAKQKYSFVDIQYRCFPIDFSKTYFHKKPASKSDSVPFQSPEHIYRYKTPAIDVFGLEGFDKSGNISRGITAGNGQNLSVTSDLNLQLAGMISPGLKLTASITDNNIPIQPDGNTQQLQDFDQVFIRLDHKLFSGTAGDFVIARNDLNFLKYSKKSQGALLNVMLPSETKRNLNVYASAAIARGNYQRFKFQGMEGNQGPYKLQGANFERYIVVLSGTERVYMDGKLLVRGESADYIIDYNTAEITFMPRVIMTKDKRFEVEFEYSEQNYSRSVLAGGVGFRSEKLTVRMDVYSEGDMKSQPIEPLSEEAKAVMAAAGDQPDQAIIPSADSIGFRDDRIMYRMTDSLGFDSVFVFSTDPSKAVYQLVFSLVGQGKGNYVSIITSANGRVFKWTPPVNGALQGDYSPVKILVTPKKRQMMAASLGYSVGKYTKLNTEIALSVFDLNTFSSLDAADNRGYAAQFSIADVRPLQQVENPWNLISTVSYQILNRNFKPIERIRSIEFDRQWNGLSSLQGLDEQLVNATIHLDKKKLGGFQYNIEKMFRDQDNQGLKNNFILNLTHNKWSVNGLATYSQTQQNPLAVSFLSHNFTVSRNLKGFALGLKEFSEKRVFHDSASKFILPGSFLFNEYGAFIASSDTSKFKYKGEYRLRKDYVSDSSAFRTATFSKDFIAELGWNPSASQYLNLMVTWRNLEIPDTTLMITKPENNAQIRFDYRISALKGLVKFSTLYESTSGIEIKKDYSYIQVAAGQGVYSWIDYNGNGIKELNEFEIAAFQDQANFIRIMLPSDEYVKVFGNRFNAMLTIQPALLWSKSKVDLLKVLARFSDNMVFNTQHKTSNNDLLTRFNPVSVDLFDSNLVYVNSFFRNSFFFNRNNPVFGLEWNFSRNMNKMLMANGYEGHQLTKNESKFRWNISRTIMFEFEGIYGVKEAFSEFFNDRDFQIKFRKTGVKISFQPSQNYRFMLNFAYGEKRNVLGILDEFAVSNDVNLTAKFTSPQRGNFSAMLGIIEWQYNAKEAEALAFEMLEGNRAGVNLRWNASYSRTLMNNLQLSIVYDGRLPAESKPIHTGTVQLRAYF